jgi:hypothetical protein
MKLAIMQPYFLPYIGYFQLVHAVDIFVFFDDAQYMRHGWINRNRILKPEIGWQYITIPLQKYSTYELIKNIQPHCEIDWKNRIMGQLQHYKNKAPHFKFTVSLLDSIFHSLSDKNITYTNFHIVKSICDILGMNQKFLVSSEQIFDYSKINDAGEWALRISEQMNADEYINPVSGYELFSMDKFRSSGIKLSFLQSGECIYNQKRRFESRLSIVDMLMFNGIDEIKKFLTNYSVN